MILGLFEVSIHIHPSFTSSRSAPMKSHWGPKGQTVRPAASWWCFEVNVMWWHLHAPRRFICFIIVLFHCKTYFHCFFLHRLGSDSHSCGLTLAHGFCISVPGRQWHFHVGCQSFHAKSSHRPSSSGGFLKEGTHNHPESSNAKLGFPEAPAPPYPKSGCRKISRGWVALWPLALVPCDEYVRNRVK